MSTARLPNLIVPGAGKSGTSSLHLYLAQHPDIAMTAIKEPHVFSDPSYISASLARYGELFTAGDERAAFRGESSTGYMLFPRVPERIAGAIPDCRLIFLLRNPIDRAISHYRWLVALGEVRDGFRDTFEADRDLMPDPRSSVTGNYGYLFQEGCYGEHLARFAAHFPGGQLLVLETGELRTSPDDALGRCWDFLGLDRLDSLEPVEENRTTPLSHPRARAWIEGRASFGRGAGRPGRSLVKRVVGARGAERIRQTALRGLGSSEVAVPVDVDRRWLASVYEADVAQLRTQYPAFTNSWTDDFPS